MESIKSARESQGVQLGDLLFFYNHEEGVHHVAVITAFAPDGTICYSAHSNDRINEPISAETLKNDTIVIVKLKDDAK